MAFSIQNEVGTMRRMPVKQLREKYVEVFGEQARSGNKDFLIKRIAWRMQANREGGLTERALKRATELANESDLRIRAPKGAFDETTSGSETATLPDERDPRLPPPNTVLTRKYKGREVEVTVLENGFMYDGAIYPTLSAAVKAITNTHWNGFAFFKIDGRREDT